MVTLSRIYTKTGDTGETALGDGARVSKDHPRVSAYGEVDELNSTLGMLLAQVPAFVEASLIRLIQNDLFDLGADLCVPESTFVDNGTALRIAPQQIARLEGEIDRINAPLAPLQSFVLPGGTTAASWLHMARTVCRRAERSLVALMRTERVNDQTLIYLNRLSDLLFVMARAENHRHAGDVLWVPGKNRSI